MRPACHDGGMPSAPLRTDGLVTGEAVLLDLRPAPFALRLLAALIDGAVQIAVLILMVVALAVLATRTGLDDGFVAAGVVIASVGAFVGYPVLSEMLLNGRSLGRLVAGTRVVREDGGPLHVRQSLIRAVMAMLEIWGTSGGIALTVAVLDRRARRLGDLMAGTLVLQERLKDRSPERPRMPQELSAWARGADVGRLPLPLLQDVRAFLPRAERINPQSRRVIARELLARTLPHVSPPPPPGTDPERFLTAVLAERSRRDEAALRRSQERQQELAQQVRALPFTS